MTERRKLIITILSKNMNYNPNLRPNYKEPCFKDEAKKCIHKMDSKSKKELSEFVIVFGILLIYKFLPKKGLNIKVALVEWLRRVLAKYMGFSCESSNLSGDVA